VDKHGGEFGSPGHSWPDGSHSSARRRCEVLVCLPKTASRIRRSPWEPRPRTSTAGPRCRRTPTGRRRSAESSPRRRRWAGCSATWPRRRR
jgi:hypothetical protein